MSTEGVDPRLSRLNDQSHKPGYQTVTRDSSSSTVCNLTVSPNHLNRLTLPKLQRSFHENSTTTTGIKKSKFEKKKPKPLHISANQYLKPTNGVDYLRYYRRASQQLNNQYSIEFLEDNYEPPASENYFSCKDTIIVSGIVLLLMFYIGLGIIGTFTLVANDCPISIYIPIYLLVAFFTSIAYLVIYTFMSLYYLNRFLRHIKRPSEVDL
ncbi:uncharacterized protein TRIADDRAFT_52634 [Trichoplax adhaerens]|uniref:Uncharacterized protein n=1 Tax=Trichoplax adhaerens TaxID=10228 RepID=B3RJI1_TRIAD|nr:hypothetical protein TRIADDRAFT_52634 [Trichoplax adhaerens]EDV29101.1 hypothetical protein TRIADDRAFT_52634 [Trichoplax adhaerens]|eukprot:XP_002108303.1 hypothetical protein TRIADDRAFT_52634 [Trichoplax adhaerens]